MSPKGAQAQARPADHEARSKPGVTRHLDLIIGAGLMVVAAAATLLPPGALRVALTLPILLFVPGYLLIQALRPDSRHWLQDVLMGLGLSLPVLGLSALLSTALPSGFTRAAIITVATLACLVFAATAAWRRRAQPAPATAAHAVPTE